MRSDVHSAALRAAAKVAFSAAFITGCAGQTAVTEGAAGGPGDTEPGTTESDVSAKTAGKTPKKTGSSRSAELAAPCHHDKDAGAAPKLSCDKVVAAAFPTEGDYPGVKQAVSAEVQSCCVELLDGSQGAMASHRWDCCANLPENVDPNVHIACTPWGPPVPPAMKRRVMLLEVA